MSTARGMVDLYVYYKVRSADAAALAPRVRALQADVAAHLGVAGQLKRRPEARDGLQTWMEVYPVTDTAFPAALAQLVAAAGLDNAFAGGRHAEAFVELDAPDAPGEERPCA
jgi:hypothetical protein